jgi:NAD(P)-dependent dehydrogenase (short-subunit alcohol dehydrogenase family)
MTESEVVLVTGGASGIGAAVAKRFAAAGTRVVIADIDEPRGAALAEQIGARFVRTDVGIEADNDNMVDAAVREFGRLDIVHLNAGVGYGGYGGNVEKFDLERYRRVMAVNLDGTTFGIRAAWRVMSKVGRGAIVVTSSLAGIDPTPLDPFYSATKHAIIGLVRSLARGWEAGGSKVTLNAVCPGFVRTPILPDETWWRIAAMGYALADPAEIAATVEFIARDERTGVAWIAQAGREPELVEFPKVDLPKTAAGAIRLR